MMAKLHGLLEDVEIGDAGSALAADAPSGSTVIEVVNPADFATDSDTGTLIIGATDDEPGIEYTYTLDGYELNLGEPLSADAFEDDPVYVSPRREQATAYVALDNGDPITAKIAHALTLSEALAPGTRATDAREAVLVERIGQNYYVVDVVDRVATIDPTTLPPSDPWGTDPPADAPVISAAPFAIGAIRLTWDAVEATQFYNVHASLTTPVPLDGSALVGKSSTLSFTLSELDGQPLPMGEDAAPVYFVVVPENPNGEAPASNEASAAARQADSEYLAADSVLARNVEAHAIDGMVVTGATVRTASNGLRTQLDSVGLRTFNASNAETARLSAEGGAMRLDGEMRVTGGISVPHPTWPYEMVLDSGALIFRQIGEETARASLRLDNLGGTDLVELLGGGGGLALEEAHSFLGANNQFGIFARDLYLYSNSPVPGNVHISDLITPTAPDHAANKAYVDAHAGGGADIKYLVVRLTNGDVSIPSTTSSYTAIQFNEVSDSEGLDWNLSSNRFTANNDTAGLFEATFHSSWRGNSSGTRYATIELGSGEIVGQSRTNPPASSVFTNHVSSMPFRLEAGDYVQFTVAQTISGQGNLNIVGSTDYLTMAALKRIGD